MHDLVQELRPSTPKNIIGQIARQIRIAEEAKEKIEKEGLAVRDLKGNIVAHPCINIEKDAAKLACEWIDKHKKFGK